MSSSYNTFHPGNHLKPPFDRAEFETLESWDLGWALLEPINIADDKEAELALSARLSPGQKALYFFWYLDAEVTNGGFIQFYWNDNRRYLAPILEGLKLIGDSKMTKIVQKADVVFQKEEKKFDVEDSQESFEKLYNELTDFEALDVAYFEIHDHTMALLEGYIRKNPGEFVDLG